jgi:uncharacterized alkaline shock family protein YloU
MADYVYIKDYSKIGQMGISKNVFEQIISTVTNKVGGVSTKKAKNSPFFFHKPVKCSIYQNKLTIDIQVIIRQGYNVEEICSSIQSDVADALTQMVEVVPFQIKIRVAGIE